MKASVLKPGLLVSLKTSLRGGVSYKRVDLEADHRTESGERRAEWQTSRVISDADEFDRATIARSAARSAIAGVCCSSSFGLLCPSDREADLAGAIETARATAAAHNETATRTQVDIFVLVGRVAQDDVEAARAIGAEVRELLDAMRAGILAADPDAIRDAASKARALGGMLSADVAGQVSAAILEARSAARELVKRVGKAGEIAADVVKDCSVQRIEAARFAFLDLEAGTAAPVAPSARGLDLAPAEPARSAGAPAALALEL